MQLRRAALWCLPLCITACGGGGSSDGKSEEVVNAGPQVRIVAPLDNAQFVGPNIIDIIANASAADGTVARVEFFVDGTSVGSDMVAPFTSRWGSPAVGTHELTAVARDDTGNTTTSSRVHILVESDPNLHPAVSLSSPSDGARMSGPVAITMTADASDPDGQVARVQFLVNSYPVGSDDTPPYSFTWTAPPGEHTLSAVATDDQGGLGSSNQVVIQVEDETGTVPVNSPPTVSMAQPTDGAEFTTPADIVLEALAADTDGSVARVDFYADGTLLASAAHAPYALTWSDVPEGIHTFYAVAIDDGAGVTTSDAVTVSVAAPVVDDPPNAPPSVSFRRPADQAQFPYPSSVQLEAAAADSDGTVARVDFYVDAVLIGSDQTAPYKVTWSNGAAGMHTLSAIAVDDDKGSASSSISISIVGQDPGGFSIDDVRLGDPGLCYLNPEFSDDSRYMVWGERLHALNDAGEGIVRMWHCGVDPDTGDFMPPDCKGFSGFDSTNWGRAYVGRDSNGVYYLGANQHYQLTMTRITGPTAGQTTVLGSLADPERRAIYPSVLPNSNKIYAYWLKSHGENVAPEAAEWVELRYVDIAQPSHEIVVERQDNTAGLVPMDVTFPRWAFHQPLIIFGKQDSGNRVNIYQYDVTQPQQALVQLTDDAHLKGGPFPVEYDGRRYIVTAMDGSTQNYLYGEPAGGGTYQIIESFGPPADETFPDACLANSPETMIKNDRLYVSYGIVDCARGETGFAFLSEPGEIWFTELLDGSDEQWRISESSTDIKNEPEPAVGASTGWVYYTSYPDGDDEGTACNEVHRAATPIGLANP